MTADINQIIISSRVRLARNIEGLPFKTKRRNAFDEIAETIKAANRGFVSTAVSELSDDMAHALFEQHLISRELLDNKINSVIVSRTDNRVVIMLGEEDHIRIQAITMGLDLDTAYTAAKKISDDIEAHHEIAKRTDFGYLTSCPTNLGTGMRASVMMFLPALSKTGRINAIAKTLSSKHITVRGVYGEGSEANGCMYQISNQACFGKTEHEILSMVKTVANELVSLEFALAKKLLDTNTDELVDRTMRAWGTLTNAYMISSAEAMELLADLKFGCILEIIKLKNQHVLDDLFFITQPNTIITVEKKSLDPAGRDKIRAGRVKEILLTSRIK